MLIDKPLVQRLSVALLFGLALVLALTRPEAVPELQPVAPAQVAVAAVERMDLERAESRLGRLVPARSLWVNFQVAGQVVARHVEPGQAVATDTLLIELESGDYADALAEAESRLEQEQAGLKRDRELLALAGRNRKVQEEEVARLEALGRKSLSSASKLGDARIRLAQLQAEEARLRYQVETAAARLRQRRAAAGRARRNLERTRLRAPFAGVVNRVAVEVGDYAATGARAVELIDIDTLHAYLEIPGELAAGLELGQRVQVDADGGTLTGRVHSLQADPDPETFTHALTVSLPGEGLRPGQLVRLKLPQPPLSGVLVVPATAVLRDEGNDFLFRLRDDHLERVPVRLGPRVGEHQVIAGGIAAGDTVVVRDVAALADGQRVTVSNGT